MSADAARAHPFGEQLASTSTDPSAIAARDDRNGSGGLVSAVKDRVKAPFVGAAGAVGDTAKGLSDRLSEATAGPLSDPFVITLIGALALASAVLGGLVLAHLARIAGFRDPESREPLD